MEVTKEMWFIVGYIFLGIIFIYFLVVVIMAKRAGKKVKTKIEKLREKSRIIKSQIEANKKVKKVKEVEPDIKDRPFNSVYGQKSKWTLVYWKLKIKDKFFPEKSVLVNMELSNGMVRHFLVLVKPDNTFKYRGKKYLVDGESKYYVIDSKLWCYDFHEDFTLPFKRKIPLTKIKKSLEYSGISEVEYATNPSTLERFTISKIAEGIMKGQQIDELFKRIQLLIIVGMTASVIHLVLFMVKSGMLSQIKIPGVV